MTPHSHAVVWIDHREAKVYHLDAHEAVEGKVHATDRHAHLHHKANEVGSGHAPIDRHFLKSVADSIVDARSILIVGPGNARKELADYIASEAPALSSRIAAVQAADHPSDGELVALARKFFKANDRMRA
jgi:stalled ribosome rescue protein Dom34